MKYAISTEAAIIAHIKASHPKPATLHACVGNAILKEVYGVVTACDPAKRFVTLQFPDGSKNTYTFDHISIPLE